MFLRNLFQKTKPLSLTAQTLIDSAYRRLWRFGLDWTGTWTANYYDGSARIELTFCTYRRQVLVNGQNLFEDDEHVAIYTAFWKRLRASVRVMKGGPCQPVEERLLKQWARDEVRCLVDTTSREGA